jgi:membrane associated rhomboid family serine protease
MLPLRDNIPSRRFPAVTLGIIVLNLLVFFQELKLGHSLEDFMLNWGIVPLRYTEGAHFFSLTEKILPLFSSMFLHGGWVHLIGNMWVLWIFGDNVEDQMGHLKYLGFYILSGLAAALLHIVTNLHSVMPTIGASGAIAGVMGAYFRFFPHAQVETLIPPFIFGPYFNLPAILFLGFWFFLQFYNGALSLASRGQGFGGVAWWAHVGGFAFGVLFAMVLGRPRERRESFYSE